MCGIAGIIRKKNNYDEKTLKAFQASLSHRGPDDHGAVTVKKTSFLHTRLSIIDVEGGHQPLESENGCLLIGNGEIYNYVELKKQYATYPYKCHSDMEPVFPVYEEFGPDFTTHLRGMYALALYDERHERLMLARDPFGIKPLYYLENDDIFAFSSEIQAFFKAGLCAPELNPSVRDEAIQLRFNTGRETPYKEIYRVLPGETLVVENGSIIKRFTHDVLPKAQKKISYDQAFDQLDKALNDSVKVHLRSDVPYGLFLSGGLDSAAVLKLMQFHTDQPIQTFTIGFDRDSVHDERFKAKHLAAAVGARHKEIHFTENDFWSTLPRVVTAIDDPIFDQAMVPTYRLAEEASKQVKVVLCGEGGDEMLAGYRRYQKASLPEWLGGRIIRKKGVFHKLEGLFKHDLSQWREGLLDLCNKEYSLSRSRIQIAQAVDCRSWLANNLLTKLDRCLMAHSLEGRTPFLDLLVTQATFSLADKYKIKKGYGKWLLRKWLERHFPEAQPFEKKRGFRVPVPDWILNKKQKLAPLMAQQEAIKEICHEDRVAYFFKNLDAKHEFAAWVLLVYALWYKCHIQRISLEGNTFDCLS